MKYIKLLLLFFIMAEVQTSFAQNWTVTGSYAYDMTVTAVLNANCMELANPSNQLAAFVNGEVRGVALSSVVVKGRYVALLTIRSNVASGESIRFKLYNAETGNVIDASTKINFQDDAVYGTPSDPYEIKTNYAPTNLTLATKSAQESEGVTLITSMSAKDLDVGDTQTFSLVSGLGSTDNAKFTISGNILFSKGAVNYDVQNKYKIRIQATDSRGCYMSDTFTISLIDRNFPPTDLTISNSSVNENTPIGSIVGSITSTDIDKSEVFTYALISGAGSDDNATFKIKDNSIVTNSVFDFETKATYTIRVQTKDSGSNTFEKIIQIGINDINDNPRINDKTLTIDEKATNGTILGAITATDVDVSQTVTYSFDTSTPTQSTFGLNAASGEITLLSNTLNFRTTQSYSLKVVATDNGVPNLTDTANLTIVVLYQNYPPTSITISNTTIKENIPVKTKIADFATFDRNIGDLFTYSLVDGVNADDNASFTIEGNSLLTALAINYEVQNTYNIRVQTKDFAGLTFQKSFVVQVVDVNEKPHLHNQIMALQEDAAVGAIVGIMEVEDEDRFQVVDFFIVDEGIPQTDFKINKQTGEVFLQSANINYALVQTYTLKIAVWDSGTPSLSDTASLQIRVVDKNYPPTELLISSLSIKENLPQKSVVGLFSSVDKDLNEVFSYALVNGVNVTDNDAFYIKGDTLFTNAVFNFEVTSSYTIRVQTKDSGANTLEKEFVITVKDVNEKPHLQNQTMTLEEDAVKGAIVGVMDATNEDQNQSLSFYIVNDGVPQTNFKIDKATGEVSLQNPNLSYTASKSYTLKIAVWDSGIPSLSDTANLQIIIIDKNYPPTELSISGVSVKENLPENSIVGVFSTIDKDVEEIFSYTLISGANASDNDSFYIKGDTLLTNTVFNFELKSIYAIRIRTTDSGGNTLEKEFVIYVKDVNERPVLSDKSIDVEENTTSGKIIGKITASDEDKNQLLSYTFVQGGQNLIRLDAVSGEVTLVSSGLDYEKVKSYSFQVVASDNARPSLSDTATLVIHVLDVIENKLESVDYVSANADGKNDYWFIENVELYSDYKLMIFDANGIMVYNIDNGYDNSWNGTYHGSLLPIGAYYYVMSNNSDGSKNFKGTITLVR